MSRFTIAAGALAALLLTASCGQDEAAPEFPNDLLTRVPADTPYVLASGEPVSEAVMEAWNEQFRPTIEMARMQVDQAIGELEKEKPEVAAQVSSLFNELMKLAEKGEREALGITREDRIVLYGNGLMPVLRLTVSDPEAFRSFLNRVANQSGVGMGSTTFEGQEVSRLAVAPMVMLGALEDGVLSVGVTTINGEAAMLEHLFGDAPAGDTLVDSRAMSDLVEKHGFLPVGGGYIDLPLLMSRLIGDGQVPGLLDDLGAVPEELTPACRTELVELSRKAPRFVLGYDEMSETSMAMRSVLELEPGIAEAISGWTVPVPGMGQPTDARYAFGMGLDGTKAAQTVKGWLKAAGERQFQCGFLAETSWQESAGQINVAPLYMVGNPKGFMFQLDELEIRDLESGDFSASASAVAVFDNAQTLAGMLRMMSPELQSMDIPVDGTPVRVPAAALRGMAQPLWLASTDQTLALALGEDAEGRVGETLNAEAAERPPFMHFDFDAGWFYGELADWLPRFARQARAAQEAAEADDDTSGEPGAEGEAGTAEDDGESPGLSEEEIAELEQAAEMMRAYGEVFGRIRVQVNFTGHGVEIAQYTSFNE